MSASSEETILTWSVQNWITVLLMVFTGLAVVGFAAGGLAKLGGRKGGDNAA